MTRSVSSFICCTWLNLKLLDPIGWGSVVNDLCYWSAHNICRMWSGTLLALLSLLKAEKILFFFFDVDLHRP
jgi:hypothetical protein